MSHHNGLSMRCHPPILLEGILQARWCTCEARPLGPQASMSQSSGNTSNVIISPLKPSNFCRGAAPRTSLKPPGLRPGPPSRHHHACVVRRARRRPGAGSSGGNGSERRKRRKLRGIPPYPPFPPILHFLRFLRPADLFKLHSLSLGRSPVGGRNAPSRATRRRAQRTLYGDAYARMRRQKPLKHLFSNTLLSFPTTRPLTHAPACRFAATHARTVRRYAATHRCTNHANTSCKSLSQSKTF